MPAEIQLNFLDEPFEGCPSSLIVSLTDPHGKQKENYTLGVLEAEAVYKLIDDGTSIQLNHRYIKNFSLTAYRESRGLEADARVEMKDMSANHAFFDSELETDFSLADFTSEKTDFSDCIFGDGPLSFYNAKFSTDSTSFENSQFGAGTANFQYAEFHSPTVTFDKVQFGSGDVQFISSVFGESRISFREVNFGDGKVDFHYTKFGDGNLTFDKAHFGGGEVSFKRVDFGHGKLDFKRAHFGHGDIDFSEADFKSGKVVFRSAVFGDGKINFQESISESDFIFDNAEFGTGSLSFFQAQVRKLSFESCQFNNYVDLRVESAQKIDLSYTIVRDIVDMMPTEHCPVSLDQMNFSGMRNLGNLYIDWDANDVLNLILKQEETTIRQKSEQFLILKETYNSTGRYADEDRAYIWYKRFELRSDLEYSIEKNPTSALWAYPTAFFKWLLFDKIGLYATEPLRVLFSVSIIYTLFSLLYLFLSMVADTYIDTGGGDILSTLNPVAKAFYYSAITFLTIGYGEYYPVGIMRLFASVEGYVGVFLMGYFSVAFVRKVLR
ncbi:MAG: hypothetical protein GWP27_05895 [Bacteroidetes bacterium]|nr:hypothetical protein [Bacteroidota bacterium]